MKQLLIPLCCSLALLLESGCKKREPNPPPPAATDATGRDAVPSAPSRKEAQAPGKGSSPVVLKVKWPVGSRYTYRMDLAQKMTNHIPQMPQPMVQDVTTAMTYAISVLKETPDEGRELEMEFLANEMEIKMAGQVMMSFDSKEAGKKGAENPATVPFRKMIGSKFHMEVDQQGKMKKVLDYDAWMNGLAGQGMDRGMFGQHF